MVSFPCCEGEGCSGHKVAAGGCYEPSVSCQCLYCQAWLRRVRCCLQVAAQALNLLRLLAVYRGRVSRLVCSNGSGCNYVRGACSNLRSSHHCCKCAYTAASRASSFAPGKVPILYYAVLSRTLNSFAPGYERRS
jgi:hypothetical protein